MGLKTEQHRLNMDVHLCGYKKGQKTGNIENRQHQLNIYQFQHNFPSPH